MLNKNDWRDPATIQAAKMWLRLFVGLAFAIILLYMLAVGRIDPTALIKAMAGIQAINQLGQGAIGAIEARNHKNE